ncbi:MAG: NADH-quinone oxidoreductase subunit M [Nitrospirae bacterium]|nr:NADH-quinone oxidoreductase subunit M [Nitrospirota bacterium]
MKFPILSLTTYIPLVGALYLLFMKEHEGMVRRLSLAVSLAAFALSVLMLGHFDPKTSGFQFVETLEWAPSLGVTYKMGVDGVSVLFIVLTTVLTVLSVLVSWTQVKKYVREFHVALLVMESAMLGVFSALDLVLFYVFWEVMLIPMFLMIGIWGGPNRIYAAVKFFLYTLAGSVLMLIGIIVLYVHGGKTFDVAALLQVKFAAPVQFWVFLAFFAAFAVKVPMWPVHTWLPDAHTEAPTAGSVILAGVLIKMGAYGFLRFSLPMFPDATATFAPYILALSLVAIIYGALVTLVQTDLKKLIAYSSVSHMGFVTLGIFALNRQGIEGGIMQMVNHGIITGALFLLVGIIYERTHSREISAYGGIARSVPRYAAFFVLFVLASLGLPGLNGFVGEFLVILGAFQRDRVVGVLAMTGIILAAVYLLWMTQRVLFQEMTHPENEKLADIDTREFITLLPLAVLSVFLGVYPNPALSVMHASVDQLMAKMEAHRAAVISWSQAWPF